MPSLNDMLQQMVTKGADSLQLRPGQAPFLVHKGETRAIPETTPIEGDMLAKLIEQLLDSEQLAVLTGRGLVDGEYAGSRIGRIRFRVRRLSDGLAIAFRSADGPDASMDAPAAAPPRRMSRPGEPRPGLPAGIPSRASNPQVASSISIERARPLLEPPRVDKPATEAAGGPSPSSAGEVLADGRSQGSMSEPGGPVLTLFRGCERSITKILRQVVVQRISDLVVSTDREARVRLASQYRSIAGATFSADDILGALGATLTDARRAHLEETGSLDVALDVAGEGGRQDRFRVNVFKTMTGLAAAFRPIWDQVPDFEALRLPQQLSELVDFPSGLVLLAGPTGSGKSTTLSVLIEHVNTTRRSHIITLEDPVEYLFGDKLSLIHQREIGVHVASFADGLRAALREAPDIILVGEMRDLDTIAATITAAETGHLVLSTLHSGSVSQAIDRMIDVFPEHQQSQIRHQLADVLRALVTQRLLPTVDGLGRVPAVEILRANYAIANMIRERRTHQLSTVMQSGRREGMLPFDTSLANLTRQGLISREVALQVARDPSHLKMQLGEG
ncbi:MAG: PilT/PilU family type 4a pilus ATPase [Myxococcales bacterium]|nr:PilT/PilU family type 4a pilus ATPase [Myxococcales bacterium]